MVIDSIERIGLHGLLIRIITQQGGYNNGVIRCLHGLLIRIITQRINVNKDTQTVCMVC